MRRGEDIEGSRIPSHWILRGMLLVLKEVEFPLTESTDDLFFEPMRCTLYKVPQALQNREDFDFIFSCMDTHAEVFVWVGQSADSKEKQKAFEIGQMYIELAVSLDGLSPDVTVYKVTEGNEPCFFTTYFSWDSSKATVHGNSFEKKLAWLFGSSHASRSQTKSNGSRNGGQTQRASALAALSSAFNPSSGSKSAPATKPSSSSRGSQRAAAIAALSTVLTAEQKKQSDASPSKTSRSPTTEPSNSDGPKSENTVSKVDWQEVKETDAVEVGSMSESNEEDSEVNVVKQESQADENGSGSGPFSYDQLRTKSANPARGIDFKRREAYLSDEEFQAVLGMTKVAFYKQPRWKQDMQKKKVELF